MAAGRVARVAAVLLGAALLLQLMEPDAVLQPLDHAAVLFDEIRPPRQLQSDTVAGAEQRSMSRHSVESRLTTVAATRASTNHGTSRARRLVAPASEAPPAFYDCFDAGESYAAAYLTLVPPLLTHHYGVNHRQHMETGGTVHTRNHVARQTVDMFDFGVEHLSWLERQLVVSGLSARDKQAFLKELIHLLQLRQAKLLQGPSRRDERASRDIVVIMPFFSGGAGDAGHSVPALRQLYLNVTFWSFHQHVRDIAVCVCTDKDEQFLRHSGLPWFEVIKEDCRVEFPNEPGGPKVKFKPPLLGVLTSKRAQQRFNSGQWNHTYLFYTESDQVLYVRNLPAVLRLATSNRWVSPHRMLPMPTSELLPTFAARIQDGSAGSYAASVLKRNSGRIAFDVPDEHSVSCCFDHGTCTTRQHWKSWKTQTNAFSLMNVDHSFPLLSGAGNFLRMSFRTCQAGPRTTCP